MSVIRGLFDVRYGLGVLTFREALQSGQGLTSVPLLDANVDVVGLGTDVLVCSSECLTLVSEGVYIARNTVSSHALLGSITNKKALRTDRK